MNNINGNNNNKLNIITPLTTNYKQASSDSGSGGRDSTDTTNTSIASSSLATSTKVLFNANSVPIAGSKVMLTAITPNFTMTWIPETTEEE